MRMGDEAAISMVVTFLQAGNLRSMFPVEDLRLACSFVSPSAVSKSSRIRHRLPLVSNPFHPPRWCDSNTVMGHVKQLQAYACSVAMLQKYHCAVLQTTPKP